MSLGYSVCDPRTWKDRLSTSVKRISPSIPYTWFE